MYICNTYTTTMYIYTISSFIHIKMFSWFCAVMDGNTYPSFLASSPSSWCSYVALSSSQVSYVSLKDTFLVPTMRRIYGKNGKYLWELWEESLDPLLGR